MRGSVRSKAAAALRIPKAPDIEEWAAANIELTESPRPGRFSLREYEYQRGIWEAAKLATFGDCFSRVVVPKGGRTGHTTCLAVILPLYTALVLRRPALIVQPRAPDARSFARSQMWSVISASPRLLAEFPGDQPKEELKTRHGVSIRVAYSSSRDSLTRVGAAFLALDEFDRLTGCGGGSAAPWDTAEMAEVRCREYRQRARIDLGTPELPGRGIMARFGLSSQGRFVVRCPFCDGAQTIELEGLPAPAAIPELPKDAPGSLTWLKVEADGTVPTATFRCRLPGCLRPWSREARVEAVARGEWVHAHDRSLRGFHVSQLYVANVSPSDVAAVVLRAESDPRAERELRNQVTGLGFEPRAGAMTKEAIFERVAPQLEWKRPPEGTTFLTMGIDVQGETEPWDYVFDVVAYGRDRAHVIEWGTVHGDGALLALLGSNWLGHRISRALIDATGNATNAAVRLSQRSPILEPILFVGSERTVALIRQGRGDIVRGDEPGAAMLAPQRYWLVAADLALDTLYLERLAVRPGEPGGIMFASAEGGALEELADHCTGLSRQPTLRRTGEEVYTYVKRRPVGVDHPYALALAEVAARLEGARGPDLSGLAGLELHQPDAPMPGPARGGIAANARRGLFVPRRSSRRGGDTLF